MMEIRFFVRMRGARTPPPMIEEPVMKIPLDPCQTGVVVREEGLYHAAPTTDNPMQSPMPRLAQACGDTSSRNCPTYFKHQRPFHSYKSPKVERTLKASPSPVKSISARRSVYAVKPASLILHAPTTVNAVVAPPRPYLKLILPAGIKLDR